MTDAPRKIQISLPSTGDEEWQAVREPLLTGWLTQGPKVAAFEKAFAALEKAGFAPTHQRAAQDARNRSVVYAAKGNEMDAARIAAALPGGATVEPLTWTAQFDVVVALGHSAQGR